MPPSPAPVRSSSPPRLRRSAFDGEAAAGGDGRRFAGRRVHFVGIGGSGMSGLARMLHDDGAAVSGTDPSLNAQTEMLRACGVRVDTDQNGSTVHPGLDLLVHTAAVPADHAELVAARHLDVPVRGYADVLGEVMGERVGVAIAGTHGKSTTSAMCAYVLQTLGHDPSFVIGASVPQLGGGSHSGGGDAFVAEACEFNRSFHRLRPTIAVITNVEEDHLDYYRDLDEIVASFREYARLVPPSDGLVIMSADDPNCRRVLAGLDRHVQTVGFADDADWRLIDAAPVDGHWRATLTRGGVAVGALRPRVPGRHNLVNAAVAVAAAVAAGADATPACQAVHGFAGVERRMTLVGHVRGAIVVDDYGHHPTEVRATLAALRVRFSPKRLICVFQPHQHSRTRCLLEGFSTSFADADRVILPPIYAARDRDDDRLAVTSQTLRDRLRGNGVSCDVTDSFEDAAAVAGEGLSEGDLVVTMGAGDVWKVAAILVRPIQERP